VDYTEIVYELLRREQMTLCEKFSIDCGRVEIAPQKDLAEKTQTKTYLNLLRLEWFLTYTYLAPQL
jgi:hypothetical protein